MGTHIDNMTTEVISEPEPGQAQQGGSGNSGKGLTERDLKRKTAIELRTRAKGFDD